MIYKIASATLSPYKNGRHSIVVGPICERSSQIQSLTPKIYINIPCFNDLLLIKVVQYIFQCL